MVIRTSPQRGGKKKNSRCFAIFITACSTIEELHFEMKLVFRCKDFQFFYLEALLYLDKFKGSLFSGYGKKEEKKKGEGKGVKKKKKKKRNLALFKTMVFIKQGINITARQNGVAHCEECVHIIHYHNDGKKYKTDLEFSAICHFFQS